MSFSQSTQHLSILRAWKAAAEPCLPHRALKTASFFLLLVSSFPDGVFFLAFTRPEGTSEAAWHLKEGKIKMAEIKEKLNDLITKKLKLFF